MGKKKSFIDKKKSSTYHLLYRSQRDVGEEGDESGVILWPSPNNNAETDQKVLLGGNTGAPLEDKTLDSWKNELSSAGLVDDYDYDRHMKPITGTGDFFGSDGKRANANAPSIREVGAGGIEDQLTNEVDRQLDSIALTADCMDDDIAQALFGDFEETDFEELNDDFMLDAAKEPETSEDVPFDFAAHVRDLMEKAKRESGDEIAKNLATVHEQGKQDDAFFASAKALGRHDDEESGYFDGADWDIEGAPGVVAKLNEAEEKALVDKFNATLLEYDSDDLGEGYDDEGAMGDRPLEGDAQVEAALEDYLLEKNDEIFMQGARHYMEGENRGGSGFSALVGTKMIPVKQLEKMENLPREEIQPIEAVLGEADDILGKGRAAPPAEEIFVDGKSYFSEKMKNPWDCESILSTYSNLDNNPSTIGATGRRKRGKNKKKKQQTDDFVVPEEEQVERIVLSEKTGLPLGVLTSSVSEIGDDTYISVNKGEPRRKNESKEEKHLRKQNIKKERQLARMQKKMMKEAFSEEFGRRTQELIGDDVGGKTVFRF
ncbi:MAG: hypothetical protein SGBAC_004531 [Bacillariaceae sp.]